MPRCDVILCRLIIKKILCQRRDRWSGQRFSSTLSVVKKRKPHTKEEALLRRQGMTLIAGVDEVGRGAWAGPLVAGAVILTEKFAAKNINDSKVLTPKQREKMFVHIVHHAVSWAVAVVPAGYVDSHGLSAANKKALVDAVKNLHRKPEAVLSDAVKFSYGKKPVKAIIDGDAKVLSIAAASIVAKVVRDSLMQGQHRLWPHYGFHEHKGYGTEAHRSALKKHGPSPIHRRSFRPLRVEPVANHKKKTAKLRAKR